jgi:hypothetical protein
VGGPKTPAADALPIEHREEKENMIHVLDHDPLIDYKTCWTCHQILSATFAKMADLHLGPSDVEGLIETIRRIARQEER